MRGPIQLVVLALVLSPAVSKAAGKAPKAKQEQKPKAEAPPAPAAAPAAADDESKAFPVTVRALSTRVMAEPDFLAEPLATVRRNSHLMAFGSQGFWFHVKTDKGVKGWIARSAVVEKDIKLSEKLGGSGASVTADEVELAGRGFSPKEESAYRKQKGSDPRLEKAFGALDVVGASEVEPKRISEFAQGGKVGPSEPAKEPAKAKESGR